MNKWDTCKRECKIIDPEILYTCHARNCPFQTSKVYMIDVSEKASKAYMKEMIEKYGKMKVLDIFLPERGNE